MNDDEKRIKIDDLPKTAEELTDEEAKKLEGGFDSRAGSGVLKSTDSGKTWTTNTTGGCLLTMFLTPSNLDLEGCSQR